jgi:SAM-dependent methyltransferase
MTHDWERIAASEAFFGVLTADKYRASELTPERIAEFYATGEADIDWVIGTFQRVFGAAPSGATALDIGCGVGRLARAMRPHAARVIGYDVSDSMLALAKKHAGEGVDYVTDFPAGPFGWINSFVVLQHIEPSEGLALLKRALAGLAPGGFASIQVTAWRTAHQLPTGLRKLKRAAHFALARAGVRPAEALIQMHDYSLTDVVQAFVEAGIEEQHLVHTDHGGHHGVWVFGRKTVVGS